MVDDDIHFQVDDNYDFQKVVVIDRVVFKVLEGIDDFESYEEKGIVNNVYKKNVEQEMV